MVRLSIPALLAFRDLALSTVLATIEAGGEDLRADARDEITSALNEAYNNIVLHAYRGVHGGRIELSVSASAGEVEIQLGDHGRGFDPEAVSTYVEIGAGGERDIDFASLPESGMGLFIMRSFMDEVTYTRGGAGKPNVLVLRKRWPVGGDQAAPFAARSATADGRSGAPAQKKETSQSGWRMRSVAVPSEASALRTAGSLKRK